MSKSLVRQDADVQGEPRFGMLETIHEYAAERLADAGESDAARSRHAAWALGHAEATGTEPRGRGPARLVPELGNLRAALAWFGDDGPASAGLLLAAALHEFWNGRALYAEGRRWLTTFLEGNPSAAPGLRAAALSIAGHLARNQGDFDAARALLEESVAIRRQAGEARARPGPGVPGRGPGR